MAALNLFDQDPLQTKTVLGDQYAEYPDLFSCVAWAYRDGSTTNSCRQHERGAETDMPAASFLLPAAGLAVWVVHVAQSVSPSRRRWAFWVWLLGLPAAVVCCFEYVREFVPLPVDDHAFSRNPFNGSDWAIFMGIVEWGLLLIAEPFLQLFLFGPIRYFRRRRQDPTSIELEDTLEIPIVKRR